MTEQQKEIDRQYMARALELAERGAGRVSPNPMVGCVIVKDGRIIGEGYHEVCGGPHAERQALAACTCDPAGATLYVTLEPCCHWGRTPPCTEAILERRIGRVVAGCLDPNPKVAGQGLAQLRAAGVSVTENVCADACRRLNRVFFHYIETKTPYGVLKYAMTLDGKLAAATGDSRWVTGEEARAHVHRTRARLSAILVGVGTVLADDPLLTCRIGGGRNPVRIVCDSHLRIPDDCALIASARQVPTLIACTEKTAAADALEAAGAEILVCAPDGQGRVDLKDLFRRLGAREIDSVLIEGGAALHEAALRAGVVQAVQAYIAPKLIGGAAAKSPVGGQGLARMADAWTLREVQMTRLGDDFLVEGVL